MSFFGNTGKILEVDLTKEKISILNPDQEIYHEFLGGSGLAARLFFHKLTKELDPLSPENPLGFFAGPLVGTKTPNCGRHVVCAKSPLTNIWGEANSGGKFGAYMKFLGFDGIIFSGKAKNPTSLMIFDKDIELIDAFYLWGKNVFDVEKELQQRFGKISSFATIGEAGENLVKIASVMNDGDRAAGRTGMGAVMGSKNLKAIILRSKTRDVQVAKPDELKILGGEMRKNIYDNTVARRLFGTAAYVSGGMKWGDVAVKYWYKGTMDNVEAIDGERMKETILVKRYHCYSCVIGCGRIVKIDEGKYAIPQTAGAEYETLAGFGTNLLINDLKGISYANYLCNHYGLDTISASQIIALTFHLHEKGIITKKELDDVEAIWGNIDAVNELLTKIARREGIGNLLAEGADAVANHYNIPEEAHTVNGLELPYHDPRAFFSMASVYATSSRGACHNNGDGYKMCLGVTVPEIDLKCEDRFDDIEAGRMAVKVQDFRAVYNALIMCHFAMPPFKDTIKALELATGWEYSIEDVMKVGERITNLKRMLNKQMGLTKANDKLPKIVYHRLTEGGTEGKIPNLEVQLKEYYKVRNWDTTTGFPTESWLKTLNLNF
ncbi:MAG TPA: aldehyde ferredoxin oxidoreductase family protein [candidate division Zixibacteria bacterium]|nr:aldehyde ferredoxin oxidoreductase family protein [candidate division Zixibacteria bacterium]